MIALQNSREHQNSDLLATSLVQRAVVFAVAVCVVFASSAVVSGQEAKKPANKRETPRGKRLPGVTPEREAAVLTFVKQHHPELTQLLSYLQTHQPRQYQRAVRELARTVERLAQIHERDMDRHDLELRAWKARSRIDLLTAQWQMESSEKLRSDLRAALVEQAVAQQQFLQSERARLLERLAKLDAQIEKLDAEMDREIESRLQALTSTPRQADPGSVRGSKKSGKKSGELP